jgi:hypothetical protein
VFSGWPANRRKPLHSSKFRRKQPEFSGCFRPARKENADNSIVKQMTRTVGIIFCTLTNHRKATRIVLKNHNRHHKLTRAQGDRNFHVWSLEEIVGLLP